MDVTPDQIFRALGDPVRLQIIDLLVERDGQALFELCGRLISGGTSITRQGVAKHLAVLVDAEIVEIEREGRITRHHLRHSAIAEARAWLDHLDPQPPSTQEHS